MVSSQFIVGNRNPKLFSQLNELYGSARTVQSVAMTTGSSSSPSGRSSNSPTEPSAGPPRPDATTPPNPPGTRSKSDRPGSKSLFGSQRVPWSLGVSLAPDPRGGFSSVPEALEPPAVHALGEWFRDLGRDDESGEENQHAEVKPERQQHQAPRPLDDAGRAQPDQREQRDGEYAVGRARRPLAALGAPLAGGHVFKHRAGARLSGRARL